MNKIALTAGITALTTIAACGGAVGILANTPSTKNMFDFTGKNQEIISELKTDISNKDSALSEKDKTIAGLENTITDKNAQIDSLVSSNAEKDNQIQGQQATIEELNELLAGPKELFLPSELSGLDKVSIVNTSSDFAILSCPNSSILGIWLLNKATGESTKIFDKCAGITYVYDVGNGKYLTSTALSLDVNYGLLRIDTNTLTCEVISEETHGLMKHETLPNGKGVVFYNTSTTTKCIVYYNLETHTLTSYNQSVWTSGLSVIDNDNIIFATKYVLNLTTGEVKEIASPVTGTSFVSKGVYYIINSSTGFYKLNLETLSYDLIDSEFKITSIHSLFEIDENTICIMDGNPKAYIYCKSENKVVATNFNCYQAIKLKNGNLALIGSTYLREYNLTTMEYTQAYFDYRNIKELPNGDIISCYNKSLRIYSYLEETNSYTLVSTSQSTNFYNYEDLGEGKYKFIGEDGMTNLLYDSVSKTIKIYSLIIE